MTTLIVKPNPNLERKANSLQALSWQVGVRSYAWSPPTDVYETEASFVVRVEAAGRGARVVLALTGAAAPTPGLPDFFPADPSTAVQVAVSGAQPPELTLEVSPAGRSLPDSLRVDESAVGAFQVLNYIDVVLAADLRVTPGHGRVGDHKFRRRAFSTDNDGIRTKREGMARPWPPYDDQTHCHCLTSS